MLKPPVVSVTSFRALPLFSRHFWVPGLLGLTLGCAPGAAPKVEAPPPRAIAVPRTVVTPKDSLSVPELYERARALAENGEHARAANEFERVARLDPEGELADDATFYAASERDLASDFEGAATGYEAVARRYPRSPLAKVALLRGTRLWAHLEQWPRAGELARQLLDAGLELDPFERVLVAGAIALARLDANDERAAETFIERGRALIDEHRLDAAGRLSRDLAPVYFALGELRRRRAERVVFVPQPSNFGVVLEQRCQLLLDAQGAYSDSMRAYDAHWSAMAGFRVGELYERLHRDLMLVEPPASADTLEKRQLFEGAMRLRYSILLKKAAGMLEHTLSMANRTGEESAWVARSRESEASIKEALRREEAAIAALPFHRSVLETAMQNLQQRVEEREKVRPAKPR